MLQLENWSRAYCIAPTIEVDTHRSSEALLDEDAYRVFERALGEPLIAYIDGVHYELKPSRSVLRERAAIPYTNHSGLRHRPALLLAK